MPPKPTTRTIKAASNSSIAASIEVEANEADDRWEARRWARGFLWLWAASTVIWLAVVGLFAFNDSRREGYLEVAAWAFIPPGCALALVLTLVWIRIGFRIRPR